MIEIIDQAFKAVFGAIGIAIFTIIFGLLYKGIDRKLAAHMQARVGPPIRQPFWDVIKLFSKENIVPEQAVGWLFNLAPVIALASSITIMLYLPIGWCSHFPSIWGILLSHLNVVYNLSPRCFCSTYTISRCFFE